MRVLVVDDEVRTAALLRRGLAEEGYAVDVAHDAADAMWRAAEFRYDLLVLDVLLPEMDGFEVCRALRASGCWAPVLMLTARNAVEDRVRGLDAGADDYLTKPFSFSELTARIRALMRRGPAERPVVLQVGDLRLDPARRQDATSVRSRREYEGLQLLRAGSSNAEIAGQLHNSVRTIEHHVSAILTKLGLRSRTEAAVYAASLEMLTPAQAD
jgi:DNA-binding response OmpR family regulator